MTNIRKFFFLPSTMIIYTFMYIDKTARTKIDYLQIFSILIFKTICMVSLLCFMCVKKTKQYIQIQFYNISAKYTNLGNILHIFIVVNTYDNNIISVHRNGWSGTHVCVNFIFGGFY